jgi:hypothetical protein
VFFWFIGTAVIAVWYVFRDPGFDYRMLAVGSVLPLGDALLALDDGPGMRWMHSLAFSVALLAAVMAATIGRRPLRKLLLGLPIGTFLHLVFDGAWATTDVFWWPFSGWRLDPHQLPEVQRGWWAVPLELIGVAIVAWVWRSQGLADPARRRDVLRTGRLFAGTPRR